MRSSAKIDPLVLRDTRAGRAAHVLVVMRRQAEVATAADAAPTREARGRVVVDRLRAAAGAQAPLRAELRRLGVPVRPFWIVNALAVTADRQVVEALTARDDVERVEPDRAFRGLESEPGVDTSARPAGVEWNVAKIDAPGLWQLGFNGQGTVYANADTGVDWTHPALKPHYRGWNGTTAVHDYNWHDAIHGDINGNGSNPCGFNTAAPCDDDFHGTHVMGIAIGDDGAGNQIGVAPGARWIGCRNMDEGVGRPSTYIECLQFFAAPTNSSGGAPDPSLRPDAVGNSYACPPDELCSAGSLQTAIDNLRAAGIFMAVAAGNGGPGCSTLRDPPALYDSGITVGSTDTNDQIATSSSRGPVVADGSGRRKPDVTAPGVQVRSSLPRGGYGSLSGTSMAAPHVGAAALLLWSALPGLRRNVDATEALLEQTAVRLTTASGCGGDSASQVPNNTYGNGRIDVLAAYRAGKPTAIAGKLSVRDTTVAEGTARAAVAVVRVRLAAPAGQPVRVLFRTLDGTAKAGTDYVRAAGTLTFPAGVTERDLRIRMVADRKHEATERFFLVLERPVNATLARARATVTITDDDRRAKR